MSYLSKEQHYRDMVNGELRLLIPPCGEEDLSSPVREAMGYSLFAGGKRVRPILTLAFCSLCGGDERLALPYACAVEMVHTYSLIHDDLPAMDNDDLRRGRPTNHRVYGEDIALLAGDGLLTLAFETALSGEDPAVSARAAKVLAKCAGAGKDGMVGGQCIDLKTEGAEVGLDLLFQMDLGKTAALISASCQMGVIAAGGGEELISLAHRYAVGLGMAFQIRDDILDVTGDAEVLGKNVGMDSQRNKRNYVSLLGMDRAQELVSAYTEDALSALELFPGDSGFLRDFTSALSGRVN